jgi:hypothetical protein
MFILHYTMLGSSQLLRYRVCAVTAFRQGGMCRHESIVMDPRGGGRCRRRPRVFSRVTARFTAPAHRTARDDGRDRRRRDRGGGAISITLGGRHIHAMQPASHDVCDLPATGRTKQHPALKNCKLLPLLKTRIVFRRANTSVHTEHESSHATLPPPGSRVHHVFVHGLQRRASLGAAPRSMTQTRSTKMRITEARSTGMADGVSALVMR